MLTEEQSNERAELVNDLVSISTVMDEVWRYHPNNKDRKDIIKEYDILIKIQKDIELELSRLDDI
jgi:hypothetical protein